MGQVLVLTWMTRGALSNLRLQYRVPDEKIGRMDQLVREGEHKMRFLLLRCSSTAIYETWDNVLDNRSTRSRERTPSRSNGRRFLEV